MKYFLLAVIILPSVFGSSCGHKKVDPILQEAFDIHIQSLDVAKDTKDLLEKLPPADTNRLKFESALKEWNDNIVEVPGFHHHHHGDDGHHHHHHHGAQLELTPDDMLLVQKELMDSIQSIHKRVRQL